MSKKYFVLLAFVALVLGACSKSKPGQANNPSPTGTATLVYNVNQSVNYKADVRAKSLIDPDKNCFQWIKYTEGSTATEVLQVFASACPTDAKVLTNPLLTFSFEEAVGEVSGMNTYYATAKDDAGVAKRIGRFQKNQASNTDALGSLCQFSSIAPAAFAGVCTIVEEEGTYGGITFP